MTAIHDFGGVWTPALLVGLFLLSSFLIIWRLERMSHRGVEGTVLGTLFMPYFSGLGNLIFVAVVLRDNGPAQEIAVNCWTNNITNLGLLLALPALIWGLNLKSKSKARKAQRESALHRLSLALTLIAMAFFSMMVWVLGQDGTIDRYDGCALVGLFLFWQCFHVYEVLKENTQSNKAGWHPLILLDILLILAGSACTLVAVDGIVAAILAQEQGWLSGNQLGLLTGWLMVLPNAVLAFYYAQKRQADVVYSSQVGDGHICIPLCIGLFAIFRPMPIAENLQAGLLILTAASLLHLLCLILFQRLPKPIAASFLAGYGYCLYLQINP
ncbi:sodium:calcium symporter [Coraliomargarita parva]|uniref:sodium:calcium symporter n=1 Tax=Coraliomargarita parva TaxID=3014050 RepID=UPI0022B5BBA9|nr:sodium:calcium symporter [Coraliomargarita parva]